MTNLYEPASSFLIRVADGDVPLSGSEFGEANLIKLIAMLHDPDRSNRDWAALLLSQQDIDTPEVRSALLGAARDEDEFVRAEAILGLAERDRDLALSFVRVALREPSVALVIFEAAAIVADRSLVGDLRRFAKKSDSAYADDLVAEALVACESSTPPAWVRPRSAGRAGDLQE